MCTKHSTISWTDTSARPEYCKQQLFSQVFGMLQSGAPHSSSWIHGLYLFRFVLVFLSSSCAWFVASLFLFTRKWRFCPCSLLDWLHILEKTIGLTLHQMIVQQSSCSWTETNKSQTAPLQLFQSCDTEEFFRSWLRLQLGLNRCAFSIDFIHGNFATWSWPRLYLDFVLSDPGCYAVLWPDWSCSKRCDRCS